MSFSRNTCLALIAAGIFGCSALIDTSGLADGDALPEGLQSGDGGDDARDGSVANDGSISSEGGDGGGPGGPSGPCPSTPPSMVRVQASTPFCVDSTEVTQAQYQTFLDATAGVVSQTSACSWNLSLAPTVNCFDPVKNPNKPVVCVDWCDAHAYCAWAGKRLCGGLGGGPGGGKPLEKLEWYVACSKNATRVYPYGASYEQGNCNDAYSGHDALVDVGTNPKCVGGFDGVFDMSGNALEWVDVCSDGDENAECQARGGAFGEGDPAVDSSIDPSFAHLRCFSSDTFHPTRASSGEWVGFRCCSDVLE